MDSLSPAEPPCPCAAFLTRQMQQGGDIVFLRMPRKQVCGEKGLHQSPPLASSLERIPGLKENEKKLIKSLLESGLKQVQIQALPEPLTEAQQEEYREMQRRNMPVTLIRKKMADAGCAR